MKRYSFGYKCYPSESADGEWCKVDEHQAEIDELKDSLAAENDLKTRNAELFNQLYAMHKSFSEDMYVKARRELEDVLEKNKQEKEDD